MKDFAIPFRGLCTALITPFRADSSVDEDAFRALIRRQADAGVDAVLVIGTTGESATLSEGERRRLIRIAAEEAAGRCILVAGTGCSDTERTVSLSRYAAEAGADAVLLVAPYYNRPTPEGLIRHFRIAADAAGCPVILYNIPARTGVDLTLSICRELAKHPGIVGIKEASGNIGRTADLSAELSGPGFAVYAGNDGEIVPTMALGGAGAVSVVSNLLPEETLRIVRAMQEGRVAEADALQRKMLPLIRALFSETNPIPIKAAMAMRGLCGGGLRLPLTEASEETRARLKTAMDSLG